MYSKVVFALVCLFVVKATAFTINTFEDDDNDGEVRNNPYEDVALESTPRRCVNSQCRDLCRRLGYSQGVCISANVCRCSRPRALDAAFDEVGESEPLNDISLDHMDTVEVNSGVLDAAFDEVGEPESLNDISLVKNNPYEDAALDSTPRRCVNSQCRDLCRRLGYSQGVCISANVCRCSRPRALDAAFDEVGEPESLNDISLDHVATVEVNPDSEPTAEIGSNDIVQNN